MNDELKTLRRLEPSRNPPDGADAREQEACTCGYVWHHRRGWPGEGHWEWETCPRHTPPIHITDAQERD